MTRLRGEAPTRLSSSPFSYLIPRHEGGRLMLRPILPLPLLLTLTTPLSQRPIFVSVRLSSVSLSSSSFSSPGLLLGRYSAYAPPFFPFGFLLRPSRVLPRRSSRQGRNVRRPLLPLLLRPISEGRGRVQREAVPRSADSTARDAADDASAVGVIGAAPLPLLLLQRELLLGRPRRSRGQLEQVHVMGLRVDWGGGGGAGA